MQYCYIAADIEGSVGRAYPSVSSMISLGACVIGKPWETFYAELKPLNKLWDPAAERVHKLSQEHLFRFGRQPYEVMREFRRWTLEVAKGAVPVFCAKPIRYDWTYVEWYFKNFNVPSPYGQTLDTRDLYRKIRGLPSEARVKIKHILRDFPTSLPHTHNALDDARELEEMMRKMLHVAGKL